MEKYTQFHGAGENTVKLYGPINPYQTEHERVRITTQLASGAYRVVDHGIAVLNLRGLQLWTKDDSSDDIATRDEWDSWFHSNSISCGITLHDSTNYNDVVIIDHNGWQKQSGGYYTCTLDFHIKIIPPPEVS